MKPATIASVIVYGLITLWYVRPWLNGLGRAKALTALLWVQVFRYTALNLIPTQRDGYPISNLGVNQIVIGDLVGAILALLAIILLRGRYRLGIAFSWLVVAAFVVDAGGAAYERSVLPFGSNPSGAWWLIFVLFVPAVVISLILLAWQLYARRGEPLVPLAAHDLPK